MLGDSQFIPLRSPSLPPSPLSLRLCHRHSPINFKSPSRRVLLITRNFEIRSHGARLNSLGKKERARDRFHFTLVRFIRTITIAISNSARFTTDPNTRSNRKFNVPSFLSFPRSLVSIRLVENWRKRLLEIMEDKVEKRNGEEKKNSGENGGEKRLGGGL